MESKKCILMVRVSTEEQSVSEFPDLKLPGREIDKFKINKLFLNKEDHNLSNFLLFQALLKKVDKELFLLPMKERILVYLVFDSNKKFVGQYTLSNTGYGDFNCHNLLWTCRMKQTV
jgi:hypothetical protein